MGGFVALRVCAVLAVEEVGRGVVVGVGCCNLALGVVRSVCHGACQPRFGGGGEGLVCQVCRAGVPFCLCVRLVI